MRTLAAAKAAVPRARVSIQSDEFRRQNGFVPARPFLLPFETVLH
jgi:hypothetical protein